MRDSQLWVTISCERMSESKTQDRSVAPLRTQLHVNVFVANVLMRARSSQTLVDNFAIEARNDSVEITIMRSIETTVTLSAGLESQAP